MHITKKKRDATTITSIIKKDDSEKLFREFNMVSEKLSFER